MTTERHVGRFYYGTAAERAAFSPPSDAVGALFWETDTTTVYVWSGTDWQAIGIESLTAGELAQLQNIDATTISAAQWGYLGAMDQGLATTDSPTFADVYLPDGGTIGIEGNELLTVNAAGTFAFSGIAGIVVEDGDWLGLASDDLRIEFNSTDGDIRLHLGDAAGSDEVQVLDSGANVVDYIDSDGNAEFEGHLAAGSLASVGTDVIAYFYDQFTANSGILLGQRVTADYAPTGSHTALVFGNLFNVNLSTAQTRTSGGIYGMRGSVTIANGIDARSQVLIGGQFLVDVEDAGSGGGVGAVAASGIEVYTSFVDTGSITTAYGVRVLQGTVGAGSITTLYGLHIAAITAGGTNYAIYSAGGQSYHAGNLGIGMVPTANGVLSLGLPTANLEFIDAGTAGATEDAWAEVEVGGSQFYARLHSTK